MVAVGTCYQRVKGLAVGAIDFPVRLFEVA